MDPLGGTPSQGMTAPPGLAGPGSGPPASSGPMPLSSQPLQQHQQHYEHLQPQYAQHAQPAQYQYTQHHHSHQQVSAPGLSLPGMPMSHPPLQSPLQPLPPSQIPPQAQAHSHGLPSIPQVMAESSAVKLTRGHSCVLCQQRKVRCDKNKPCANCVKAQVECRVVPPQPPRRRKKKPQERELVDRLRKYESLLSQHGVTFDPIAHEFKHSEHGASTIDELDELQDDLNGLKTSPSSSHHDYASEPGGPSKQSPYRDYRSNDDTLHDSSDDEVGESTIHHAFDNMFDNQDGFPFMVGGSFARVTEHHPPGIQIFQLWQTYLTNVNPLLKITHTPSLQAQIIEAGTNVAKISRPLEALMFSIYFMAITSMTEDDVQSAFDEDRARLLSKFHRASQQALINAGFMRSPDIMVLQAYFLYLVSLALFALPTYQQSQLSVRQYVDPRSLFCLIGIAVRIAQRLGLHRDGAQFGLAPFEVELRRRLWWQIVIFDKRIAEMTGSVITALSSSNGDTKFPLNINDTDLHVDAKDPPTPYAGPTEMLFCLTRIEMCAPRGPADGQAPSSSADESTVNTNVGSSPYSHTCGTSTGTAGPSTASNLTPGPAGSSAGSAARKFHYSPNPVAPDVATHVAHHTLPSDTESYCQYMENTYLKACDTKIPLHFFTLMMTRQVLAKLRMINLLVRSKSAASDAAGSGVSPSASALGGNPAASMGAGGMMGSMGGMGGGMMSMSGGMMGGMLGGGGPGVMGMGMGGFGFSPPVGGSPSDAGSAGSGGRTGASLAPSMDDADRDALFLEAINVIEYDNIVQGAQNLRGLMWYTAMHFPFPAYMVIAMQLRSRHTGTLVERAWTAICENHDRRGLAKNLRSPIHVSFGAHFIKAWDARVAAEQQQTKQTLKTPMFIKLLKATLHKTNPQAAAALAASQQARQASGQPVPGDQVPIQQPLPQIAAGHSEGGMGARGGQQQHSNRPLEEGTVMAESPPQPQQQHHNQQQMAAQGPHPSAVPSMTSSSPPAVYHPPKQQQHQSMVYATPTPPPQSQQQQPGAFDGMVPVQPLDMGLPGMMDFNGPVDWNLLVQGQYNSGYSNGGGGQGQDPMPTAGQGQGGPVPGEPSEPSSGYGGSYTSMYSHGG